MEALDAGVPAIATRLSGIPELVEDGVSGWLVEPGDARALAGALRHAFEADPDESARRADAGRRKVREEFALATVVAQLAALLDEHGAALDGSTPDARAATAAARVAGASADRVGLVATHAGRDAATHDVLLGGDARAR